MTKMMRFEHTERTAKIFDSIIKEYREVRTDSDLETIGISYDDYHSSELNYLLSNLRFNGEGMTSSKKVAEWMKRHGCNVYLIDTRYRVQL